MAGRTRAESWRTYCTKHSARFRPLGASPQARRRGEQIEKLLIEQFCQPELPLDRRAAAFRQLVDLRGCTARDVATFFGVEPEIVIRGLSLLELPQHRPLHSAVVASPRAKHSRTKAA